MSTITPCPMPSISRIRRCSSDCGFHPSVAATTNRQASTAPTPASMLRRKRTCPGTSTKLIPAPDGSVVCAKPRSIVSPRRFSSSNRSGSVPVSASTSVDLPWSTWPAVATTLIGRDRPAPRHSTSSSPGSTLRRSRYVRPSRTRATIGVAVRPERGEMVAVEHDTARRDRHAGRRAGTRDRLGLGRPRRHPTRRRSSRPARAATSTGLRGHPPERDLAGDRARQVGERDVLQRGEHAARRSAAPGRADGRAQRRRVGDDRR